MFEAIVLDSDKIIATIVLTAVFLTNVIGAIKLYRWDVQDGQSKSHAFLHSFMLFLMIVMIPLGWFFYWMSWQIDKYQPSQRRR